MRPPSAAELTRKWEKAPWSRSLHDPSKPYEYDSLDLRLCRAISWLGRAEKSADADAQFIFHWIAFNAMYGRLGDFVDDRRTKSEKKKWCEYFKRIIAITDPESYSTVNTPESVIYNTIYHVLLDEVYAILNNRYVFQPFWINRNNPAECQGWKQQFDEAQAQVKHAVNDARTKYVLCELFDRLYTLRNQLLHGSATWNGRVNRSQVTTGAKIMSSLIPHFIDVMIEHPKEWGGWGAPRYPVVPEDEPESGWPEARQTPTRSRATMTGVAPVPEDGKS